MQTLQALLSTFGLNKKEEEEEIKESVTELFRSPRRRSRQHPRSLALKNSRMQWR
jgi:hypothetical protein